MDQVYVSKIFGREIEFDKIYNIDGIEFDITPNINWKRGQFGDDGSCFLSGGSRSVASTIMMTNGVIAYRLYKNNKGYSRAWLYKDPDWGDRILLFNFQGRVRDHLENMKKVFGLEYTSVEVNTSGRLSEFFYADGRVGYLLSREKINKADRVELKLSLDLGSCSWCKSELTKDAPIVYEGKNYCPKCFTELFFYCSNCYGVAPKSEERHLVGQTYIVCKNCEVNPCRSCGVELCSNLIAYDVRRRRGNKRIYKRLWFCAKPGCRPKMLEELDKPIGKPKKEG